MCSPPACVTGGLQVGSLETPHNVIHGVMGAGGHMNFPSHSGFDPVFWLHHCTVDRHLALWEALNPQVITRGDEFGNSLLYSHCTSYCLCCPATACILEKVQESYVQARSKRGSIWLLQSLASTAIHLGAQGRGKHNYPMPLCYMLCLVLGFIFVCAVGESVL